MENLKISLLSDSHDNIENLKKVVDISNDRNCSHIFHLGDIVAPISAEILKNFNGEVIAVFGNCDGDKIELKRVFNLIGGEINKPPYKFRLFNRSFILMHEPFLLREVILSGEPDFIFFGHTHECDFRREGKTVIINPGETAGIKNKPTFYIMDIFKDDFEEINL
ncbi:MAG: metallophosphoesterase [Candidatus Aminicenantes bacterium]|nr:metallophosphoesterase [Candidatus Aminicenantes bacterium]